MEDTSILLIIDITCWLNHLTIEFLRVSLNENHAFRFSLVSPLERSYMPVAKSLLMREGELFVLKIDYFDECGNHLEICDNEDE